MGIKVRGKIVKFYYFARIYFRRCAIFKIFEGKQPQNSFSFLPQKKAFLKENKRFFDKLFYCTRSWLYFLVVGLSVESCCDDNEEKIVNG